MFAFNFKGERLTRDGYGLTGYYFTGFQMDAQTRFIFMYVIREFALGLAVGRLSKVNIDRRFGLSCHEVGSWGRFFRRLRGLYLRRFRAIRK